MPPLTKEEIRKRNNICARKSRQRRKEREEYLADEVKRLREIINQKNEELYAKDTELMSIWTQICELRENLQNMKIRMRDSIKSLEIRMRDSIKNLEIKMRVAIQNLRSPMEAQRAIESEE